MAIKVNITRTGLCFIFLLMLIYLFSLMSQTGLLYIIMGIILGIYVINFLVCIKGLKSITVSECGIVNTTEGEITDGIISFRNFSNKAIGFISLNSELGTLLYIKNLPGKSERHIGIEKVFHDRGIYHINYLILESVYPFGFLKIKRKIFNNGKIVVYPKIYYCQAPDASGFEPMLGGIYKGIHKSTFGDDFAGVRKYTEGDPLKYIHWKASSKGQGIFVKEFNEEFSGRLSVIMDLRYNVHGTGNIFNHSVRAAGSLAFSALELGHHVEITDLAGNNRFKASPFSDIDEMLEYLAGIQQTKDEFSIKFLEKAIIDLPNKSSLAFIMLFINNPFIEYINRLNNTGRKITLYLPKESNYILHLNRLSSSIKRFYFEKCSICSD